MRIIIAEDEKRARRGLRNLLETISEETEVISEAADGKTAFELIRTLHPDVVFTDIRMPYMDGLSLIRAVREQHIDVKFVIITAYEEFEFARQACSLGVVDYLVKPLTVEDLSSVLHRLTAKAPADASAKAGRLREEYPDCHPLIRKSLDIIEASYATKISQKELAETLGLSAEYFSFLFARDVGENFSRFLRKYRIGKAKELMDSGAVAQEEIPYTVGFSDPKYFSKCFKEETGMSVTGYRRAKQ